VLLGANGGIKTIQSNMQKLSNEEAKQLYNQVCELHNKVQTELDTMNPFVDGRTCAAIPMAEAKERAMLKSLKAKLTDVKYEINLYFRAHNHEKNIWED